MVDTHRFVVATKVALCRWKMTSRGSGQPFKRCHSRESAPSALTIRLTVCTKIPEARAPPHLPGVLGDPGGQPWHGDMGQIVAHGSFDVSVDVATRKCVHIARRAVYTWDYGSRHKGAARKIERLPGPSPRGRGGRSHRPRHRLRPDRPYQRWPDLGPGYR